MEGDLSTRLAKMTTKTHQVYYAVQCRNADFDNWDTIRDTITPAEARARRHIGMKRRAGVRRDFRMVRLETQIPIAPIEADA
jgi:hypothetical protein